MIFCEFTHWFNCCFILVKVISYYWENVRWNNYTSTTISPQKMDKPKLVNKLDKAAFCHPFLFNLYNEQKLKSSMTRGPWLRIPKLENDTSRTFDTRLSTALLALRKTEDPSTSPSTQFKREKDIISGQNSTNFAVIEY